MSGPIEVEVTEVAEEAGIRIWEVATPEGVIVGYDYQVVDA